MIVNSKHVFSVSKFPYVYQVIDEREGEDRAYHRYTVLKWKGNLKKNRAVLVESDTSIYATTKMNAIAAFNTKYARKGYL